MKKKLGSALRHAVRDADGVEEKGFSERTAFLKCLEAVYSTPGISLNGLSRRTKLSWGVGKKVSSMCGERGYVEHQEHMGKSGLIPLNRISDGNKSMLVILADERVSAVIQGVLFSQGIEKGKLLSSIQGVGEGVFSQILDMGLVSVVKDGRKSRVFPGPKLEEVHNDLEKHETDLARSTMKKLLKDGFNASQNVSSRGLLSISVRTEERAKSGEVKLPISLSVPYK